MRGVTRFADGIDLDLGSVSGLVAVVGPNGAGKTTLMEALLPAALYREMPARGTTLAASCPGPAVLDLTLEHDGASWRLLHQLDPTANGGRGRAEAILYRDGVPLTGGRLTDFDEEVGRRFPTRDVVLASVFAAQGGIGSFATLAPRERRDLLAKILGLDELQQLAARAKAAGKVLQEQAALAQQAYTAVVARETQRTELRVQRAGAEAALAADEATVAKAEEEERLEAETRAALLAGGEMQRQRAAEVAERRKRLEERITALGGRNNEVYLALNEARVAAESLGRLRDRVTLRAALQEEREQHAGVWRRASAQAAEAKARLERAQAARDTASFQAERLKVRRAELAALADAAELLEAAQAAEGRCRAEATQAEVAVAPGPKPPDPAILERDIAAARARAALVDRVPCGGRQLKVSHEEEGDDVWWRADGASCELLKGAVGDARWVAEHEPELERQREALVAWVAEDAAYRSAVAARQAAEQRLADAKRATDAAAQRVRRAEELRRDLEGEGDVDLDTAERALQEAQEAHTAAAAHERAVAEAGAACRKSLDATLGAEAALASAEALAARVPQLEAELAQVDRDRRDAQEELRGLPSPATVAAPVLPTGAKERTQAARVQAATSARRLAALDGTIASLGDVDADKARAVQRQSEIGAELSGWVLLERAMGPTGIQALEIDAAGPALSELTTELLAGLVGPRWAVQLRTIREAEGAKAAREVCELLVTDGLRGGERVVNQLSGGEQTVVEEALKLAIAVHNARRTGVAMGALFRDECDGRLHPDVAIRYPEMLRTAAALGGFGTVYFVTHRPELAAQADWQLQVGDGGDVRLV